MAKALTRVRCGSCGHVQPRWVGRCPECGEWGSMVEEALAATRPAGRATNGVFASAPLRATVASAPARPLPQVAADASDRLATGIGELDRVLGGGLVPGSVTLVGGEPGAGKSTLLLQAAAALAGAGRRVLYVSAEESPGQVRLRADRLGALHDGVLLAAEQDLGAVLALIDAHDPDVVVLDSIQTVAHLDVAGGAGGVAQVRECAAALTRVAKQRGIASVLVGHVTKDGSLAGPRTLEHLVDTVCEFDGDRHHALRLLRVTKHRFGAVGEVGCFEMTTGGLLGIADAGRRFVGDAPDGTAGVAVTIALEGRRAIAAEVQALVGTAGNPHPRRVASGLDGARLALLVAVLQRRQNLALHDRDVFASTVGGLRLAEPALDLALCLAIAGSMGSAAIPRDLVVLGEVGLAGELRLVAQTERRLAEAARLGFGRALLPAAYDGDAFGLNALRGRDLADACLLAFDAPPSRPR